MRAGAAILSLLCSLGAASAARAANTDELRIEGHINAAIAGQMHDALGHGARAIRVTSGGGDPLPALALARDMRRHHTTLIVDGVCAGACANFLFPAAAKRTVMPNALVIFSGTATALLALVAPEKTGTLDAGYAPTALQEKTMLSDAGVNQALLLDPARADALVLRAAVWRRMDMLDEARTDIEKALALDPEDAEALLERGILRQRQGDLAGARQDWTRAQAVDPTSEAAELAAQNLTLLDSGPARK